MKSHVWYCSKVMKGKDVQLMARNAKANLSNKKETTCCEEHIVSA